MAGPGYHRFVGRVLERLSAELAIDWTDGDGATAFVDRQGAERLYLGWLGPQLAAARGRVRRGERAVPLGMPASTKVTTESALATVLGPRDEDWLDSAIADPRVALGVTPWWADATDGQYLLNRALVLMWLQVRWRTRRWRARPISSTRSIAFCHAPIPSTRARVSVASVVRLTTLRGIDDPMARQPPRARPPSRNRIRRSATDATPW